MRRAFILMRCIRREGQDAPIIAWNPTNDLGVSYVLATAAERFEAPRA